MSWIVCLEVLVVLLLISCAGPVSAPTTQTQTSGSETATSTVDSLTIEPGTTAASPPTSHARTPVPLEVATAVRVLGRLVVAAPSNQLTPYRRAAFGSGGWDYDPASGCNTRERVLIEESLTKALLGARCRVLGGRWVSLYDGVVTSDPAQLQIDHFVPLAEAWRSGASLWTAAKRRRFANDLSDPNTLIAVTGRTNESKSDDTPDEWLPPAGSAWCAYAARWVEVKVRWSLTVTASELHTLSGILSNC